MTLYFIEASIGLDPEFKRQLKGPIGPFDSPEEASVWLEDWLPFWGSYSIVPLHDPTERNSCILNT